MRCKTQPSIGVGTTVGCITVCLVVGVSGCIRRWSVSVSAATERPKACCSVQVLFV